MLKFLEMLSSDDERSAFQSVYEDNYSNMYYVAFNMLKDKPRAEGAVNNAFLKLAESYPYYISYSPSKLRSICLLMVKQSVINMIRKEKYIDNNIDKYDKSIIPNRKKVIESIISSEEKLIFKQVF